MTYYANMNFEDKFYNKVDSCLSRDSFKNNKLTPRAKEELLKGAFHDKN